jgi:hypothetical protein
MTNIGIIGGLTCERLCEKILSHAKMEPRKIEDQRLKHLGTSTTTRYWAHFAPGERPRQDHATPQPAPILASPLPQILAISSSSRHAKKKKGKQSIPACHVCQDPSDPIVDLNRSNIRSAY